MLFQVECGNLHLLQPGTNFLALRCITRKPLKYFLEKRLETFTDYDETSGTSMTEESVYHSQDYKRLFNLARCENGLEERMEAYMVAVYLLRILQQMEYFGARSDKSSLTEEEVYIGMLLAHFVQVAERNSQSMNEVGREQQGLTTLPQILAFEPVPVGYGIHPTLALVNHGCEPNTAKVQHAGKTILVAARRIEQGEQILDNYGPNFYTSPLQERRKELGFSCTCAACKEDWPLLGKLSSSLNLANSPSPLTAAGSLERGRMANALMAKLTNELALCHYNKVLALCGEYSLLLSKLVGRPHRFHFNVYMLAFYAAWAKWGARQGLRHN